MHDITVRKGENLTQLSRTAYAET